MNYSILFLDKLTKEFEKKVWDILVICDNDFTPPLSSRTSTTQVDDFDGNSLSEAHLKQFFEELKEQPFLLVLDNNNKDVIGFLSFKHNYINHYISEEATNYITLTCVLPNYRNKGIGYFLHLYLESDIPHHYKMKYISQRTSSINYHQLRVYEKAGYKLVSKIENHRGCGIDTLYYFKQIY